jgi:hypothetical protein
MPQLLTRLKITEVSAVDRAAGEGTKIVLLKRDDTPRSKPHLERYQRRLRKLQESRSFNAIIKQLDDQEISPLTGAAYSRTRLPDLDDDDDRVDDDNDDDIEKLADHHASTVADLLVEAGSFPHRASALSHLLHKPSGQALLARMHKAADQTAKETSMTSHSEFVQSVVKQYGVVALAKSMVQDQKSYGLDEPTFTRLATEHAQRIYSNDRPDVAFSKLYQSEESVRRACQIAKAMPFVADLTPLVVGGEANRGGDVNPNDPSEAIAQLKQLGARKWPTASEAVQFENALVDPVNHKLARRAVPIPQATTSFPYPR